MKPCFIDSNNQLDPKKFTEQKSHYENAKQTMDWMSSLEKIQKVETPPLEALVNKDAKRGILTSSIAYGKQPTSRTKLAGDIYNSVKTVSSGEKAARGFLSKHPDHTLGLSIGSYKHDTCMFMKKKSDEQYESVWFNPTPSNRTHNVEIFLDKFNVKEKRGYNAPDNNEKGYCSGYVWNEMNNFLVNETQSPFDRKDLKKFDPSTRLYK